MSKRPSMYIFTKETLKSNLDKLIGNGEVILVHPVALRAEYYQPNKKHKSSRVHYEFSFNPNPTTTEALAPVNVVALMIGRREDFKLDVLQVLQEPKKA